jgi:hypothetical protein
MGHQIGGRGFNTAKNVGKFADLRATIIPFIVK